MTLVSHMSAEDVQDRRWASRSLVIGSLLAGAPLLAALAGSSLLPKPHVEFVLVLSLLSAFALIDQALNVLSFKEIRMTVGVCLSTIAMVVLFCH